VSRRIISTKDSPAPSGAYSQGVAAAGELVFLAGQGPFRPDGSKVNDGFETEARQTFANLAAVAQAAGASLSDAVRVGVFLRDMENFDAMDAIYREFFPEPRPARTTVQSDLPGFEIEVDAIVVVPSVSARG
jgi:2-iminobutanoate/2-iminopropanoate deaminase